MGMKKFVIGLLLLAIILFGAAVSMKEERMPAEMPNDFNFIVAYGRNAKNKIDSFKGEYTKDLVMAGSATCKITFTDEEMRKIYTEMQRIDIINYPLNYTPPYVDNPKSGLIADVTSYSTYYFKVQFGNEIKEINWVDRNKSQASDARQLHTLIRKVMEIVETKEEYKKLPKAKGGYL